MKFVNENDINQLNGLNEFTKINSDNIKSNAMQPLSISDKTKESRVLDKADQLYSYPFQGIIKEYMLDDTAEPQEVEQEETKIYYLALGDSLTRGVGDEERKSGYTKRLAEKIEQWSDFSEVVLDNRGKRGRRSDQLLALLEKGHYDNEIKNSQLITITIGGNDIMKVVKKDIFNLKKEEFDNELVEFELRIDKIIKEIRLRNPDVPIILIGLYNPFSVITDEITEFESIISEWNKSILEVSENYPNACFVDVEDLFDTNANLVYHTDFFHPNGYGYTIMTERIVSIMKNCNIEDPTNGLILFH
ncbi:GDSL-type esterase/lipase family protein [Lysinibacillus telephonicus]|uniref:GDSL-type esterase/lipase family protein n=1 Tax=Lysinibacillus telephonicus TaxID=1714840 RepID=UPI0031FCBE80